MLSDFRRRLGLPDDLEDVLDQFARDATNSMVDGTYGKTLERSAFIGAAATWSTVNPSDAIATQDLGATLAQVFDTVDDRRASRISLIDACIAISVAVGEAGVDGVCRRLFGSCVVNAGEGGAGLWQTVDLAKVARCVTTVLAVKGAVCGNNTHSMVLSDIATRRAAAICGAGGGPQFQRFCDWFCEAVGWQRSNFGASNAASPAVVPASFGSSYVTSPARASPASPSRRGGANDPEAAYFDLAASQEVASSLRYALALQKQEHFELVEKYRASTMTFQSELARLQQENEELKQPNRDTNPIYAELGDRLSDAFKVALALEVQKRENVESKLALLQVDHARVHAARAQGATKSVSPRAVAMVPSPARGAGVTRGYGDHFKSFT